MEIVTPEPVVTLTAPAVPPAPPSLPMLTDEDTLCEAVPEKLEPALPPPPPMDWAKMPVANSPLVLIV